MFETLIKIAGIGIASALGILLLKNWRPEFAIPVTLIAAMAIFGMLIGYFKGIFISISEIYDKTGLESDEISLLIKIIGIAYLSEFTAGACRDSGDVAIASKIEIAGRVCIVWMIIPTALSLLQVIADLIPAS